MDRNQFEFHIAEYNAIQAETHLLVRRSSDAVLYSLIANGVIVAWISETHSKANALQGLLYLAAFIPVVITISAWLIHRRSREIISSMDEYCSRLENTLSAPGFGFYSFLAAKKGSRVLRARHIYSAVLALQFVLAIALVILMAFR